MTPANIYRVMREVVTVAQVTHTVGGTTIGVQSPIRARIQLRLVKAVNAQGLEIASDTQVIAMDGLIQGALVWLPGTDTTDQDDARMIKAVRNGITLGRRFRTYEALL